MTKLLFLSIPQLLIFPLLLFVLSTLCAVFKKKALSVVNILLHIIILTFTACFGGSLTDIFAITLFSLSAYLLFGGKSKKITDSKEKEADSE